MEETDSGSKWVVVGIHGSPVAIDAAGWAADEAMSLDVPLRLVLCQPRRARSGYLMRWFPEYARIEVLRRRTSDDTASPAQLAATMSPPMSKDALGQRLARAPRYAAAGPPPAWWSAVRRAVVADDAASAHQCQRHTGCRTTRCVPATCNRARIGANTTTKHDSRRSEDTMISYITTPGRLSLIPCASGGFTTGRVIRVYQSGRRRCPHRAACTCGWRGCRRLTRAAAFVDALIDAAHAAHEAAYPTVMPWAPVVTTSIGKAARHV